MLTFLITFVCLYGGMHLYAFYRIRTIQTRYSFLYRLLKIWMILMTCAPLLTRIAEKSGTSHLAALIAWPAFVWMGFIFIFSALMLTTDVIASLHTMIRQDFSFNQLFPFRTKPHIPLAGALLISVYSSFEAHNIRSTHITIKSAKLAPASSPVRIVQISDVHLGLLLGEERLRTIVSKITVEKPDILISTGDLVDGKLNKLTSSENSTSHSQLIRAIHTPLGKYAITGNHEVYSGIEHALSFTKACGFTLLRDSSVAVRPDLLISGVDDRAVYHENRSNFNRETKLFTTLPASPFHIFLKHRPELSSSINYTFDLMLSGHVHGGQIFPFNLLVKLQYSLPCGLSTLSTGAASYISRGTGTWGPPMRFLAPPEITVFEIVPYRP